MDELEPIDEIVTALILEAKRQYEEEDDAIRAECTRLAERVAELENVIEQIRELNNRGFPDDPLEIWAFQCSIARIVSGELAPPGDGDEE